MSLRKALEKLKYDTRMVQINEKNGDMPKAQLDQHIAKLEDLSDRVVTVDLESKAATSAEDY